MAAMAMSASSVRTLSLAPSTPTPSSSDRHSTSRTPSLVSRFYGAQLQAKPTVGASVAKKGKWSAGTVFATAAVDSSIKPYALPSWADFEMGKYPVYWETATGRPPTSGQLLTIYFNAAASKLTPNVDFGIAFNGGFNQPIMCGGEPRVMSKKERGSLCDILYSIKINMPLHANSLEFSFTDGVSWDGPYKLVMELPAKLRGLPQTYFNERLAKDLAGNGVCESHIYPEAVFVQDRCLFPSGIIQEGGDRCDLDIVPGCIDPESPYFDPLANVDDGSCPSDLL